MLRLSVASWVLFGLAPVVVTAADTRAETLVVVTAAGPNSMDIHGVGANRPAYGASWNLYDRLVSFGSKVLPDGSRSYDHTQVVPELAESWEISPDRLSLTFHLRRDAVFHDGSPVTAEDLKWSFDRAVSVGGFPTFMFKAGSLESPEQFAAVDRHTFRVTLPRPDRLALPVLASPVAIAINSRLARSRATAQDPWAMEWLKANDAGSGAYKLVAWQPGTQTAFERFEAWKSGPRPALRRVLVREVPSAGAQLALLRRGDADVIFNLPAKDARDLAAEGRFTLASNLVENAMWYVGLKADAPPFDQVKVRQAVALAIPYEAIMSSVAYGRGRALFGGTEPPTAATWPSPTPWRTDLTRARTLLAEAGYPEGFASRLALDQSLADPSEPIALLVQEALAKIGIRVVIEKIPGANWRAALLRKDLPMLVNNMGGWLNYPEYFFFWAYHGQNAVFNTMSYHNARLDALVEAARRETDDEAYQREVAGFITIAYEEVPRVPLYQPVLDVALRKPVTGYQYWFHRQLDFRQLAKP
ncbi:MAG: ABC transporter substrate-binding protein [Opitutaceae bacterium]|nr:ABC transporter substrate-binding protein [Opitutaceae bacterium]